MVFGTASYDLIDKGGVYYAGSVLKFRCPIVRHVGGSFSEAVRDETTSTRLRPLYKDAVVIGGASLGRLFGGISSMIHVVPPLGSSSEAARDEKASTRLRPLYRGRDGSSW